MSRNRLIYDRRLSWAPVWLGSEKTASDPSWQGFLYSEVVKFAGRSPGRSQQGGMSQTTFSCVSKWYAREKIVLGIPPRWLRPGDLPANLTTFWKRSYTKRNAPNRGETSWNDAQFYNKTAISNRSERSLLVFSGGRLKVFEKVDRGQVFHWPRSSFFFPRIYMLWRNLFTMCPRFPIKNYVGWVGREHSAAVITVKKN